MKTSIQDIFLKGYESYDLLHRLPEHFIKAANRIMTCRTKALGGHTQGCPDGHFKRHWYNSCRHRMCPLCAFSQIERWLAKQKARILNTAHFHVIFTISDELHALWHLNTEQMGSMLFKSATETLFELLNDGKYLGAKPGIIGALHTWTKTLRTHPHLHCLVTAGGFDGEIWKATSRSYLLPFGVVREKFKGKFLASIRKSLDRGDLVLQTGKSPQQVKNLLNKLGRKKWNVHLKETYSHGEGVLIYLSRYLRGGPISNKRIFKVEDSDVTFNYGREKVELMTLPVNEFIDRYLRHVPEAGSVRIRSYGIYHHCNKQQLDCCRQLLGQGPVEEMDFLTWQEICDQAGISHPEKCPVCGKQLICIESIPVAVGISRQTQRSQALDVQYGIAA